MPQRGGSDTPKVCGRSDPEESESWESTFLYGDMLRVKSGEQSPGIDGEARLYYVDESDADPEAETKKTLIAGPQEVTDGKFLLSYDTRERLVPILVKEQNPRGHQTLLVEFDGADGRTRTWWCDFKLVKAPAVELAVAGEAVEGSTLEASFPDARDNEGAAFRWLRDGESIPGATGRSYKLTAEDAGHKISVEAKSDWHEGLSRGAALVCAARPGGPAAPGSGKPAEPGKPGLPATSDPAAAIGIASALGAAALGAGAAIRSSKRARR